jgi:anaerobic ribonucleoside-triphosphate reductase activating protein
MRYSGLILNDFAAAPGVCVSLFVQGCPLRCPGCQNPETWSFDGGLEFDSKTLDKIITGLTAQGIQRNFCVMGGEPMCRENLFLTCLVIKEVKEKVPDAKIYVWSGYTYEELLNSDDPKVKMILDMSDVLVDGPYVQALRDITLPMRGSSNQRIIELKEKRNESKTN